MGVEIRLAGGVGVQGRDGVDRHLTGTQAYVALARLTLERDHGTTRDQLAGTIWPDRLPATWSSALRTLVSRLRGFLAAALLVDGNPVVAHGGRYELRLPADARVDVELAEQAILAAQDALARRRLVDAHRLARTGVERLRPPLLPESPGEWVAGVQEHFGELLVTGLETASAAALALGDHATALALANEAVSRAPLRESAHRGRMAAHTAAGNRAQALRAYQRLRRVLADELGANPAPETEAAYLEILGSTGSAPCRTTAPGRRRGRALEAPFVGRDREMAVLSDAWADALARFRQLVVVTGEAGSGKSRLVAEAALRASTDGALVLLGQCDEEPVGPYQPFVEALDGYLATTPADELPALSPGARAALAAVVPSTAALEALGSEAVPRADVAVPRSARSRLFEAVSRLVVSAARDRPVVLVLDEMHRADGGTLALLRHVLRRSRGARLLLVAIARDDVGGPALIGRVGRPSSGDGDVRRIALRGLGAAAVATLVERVLPPQVERPATLVLDLVDETAGNPALLLELLRHPDGWSPGGLPPGRMSPGVRDLVDDKVSRLDDAGRRLVAAAAVAGPVLHLDRVVRASGLDEATALDALDDALAKGVLVEVGEGATGVRYRFAHAVTPRVLRSQLSRARQRYLEARLGGEPGVPGGPAGSAATCEPGAAAAPAAAPDGAPGAPLPPTAPRPSACRGGREGCAR